MRLLQPKHSLIFLVLLFAQLVSPAWAIERGTVYEPLDLPAVPSSRATRSNLFGITLAGDRLVAVGQRGFILYSDDQGANWQQADVPVRSTLLSVYFPTPQQGWAVGHDGVILHSSDAGETWVKQLDGYQAVEIGLAYYAAKLEEEPENELYQTLLGEFEFAQSQGADRPFFMVWFENQDVGYAIGAYGMAFWTSNGGADWEPLMELQANPYFHHLFDYLVTPEKRYLAGEAGELWIQDAPEEVLHGVEPFYDGSLYTIARTCSDGTLLAAGLRGNAFSSSDEGETWSQIELPTSASIVGSTCMQDGRFVLVTQAGEILVSQSASDPLILENVKMEPRFQLSDVVQVGPDQIVVVGLGGVATVSVN